MALLLARARTGDSGYAQVSIAEAGTWFALPVRYGLTIGGPLSGALLTYGIYRARDGYIALAVLEPHFFERFIEVLALQQVTRESLERLFLTRSAREWEAWAQEQNIPLAAVCLPGDKGMA
jgi:crotonobetainyl-CoA:carnitine CoA-transferase CaiB-like acyl-CoA transferase